MGRSAVLQPLSRSHEPSGERGTFPRRQPLCRQPGDAGRFPRLPRAGGAERDGEREMTMMRAVMLAAPRRRPQDQTADIVVPQPLAAAADGFEPGIEFRVFHGEHVHDLTLVS